MPRNIPNAFLAAAIIGLLVGCGDPAPEVIQASGVVTVDGKPLPRAVVSFVPTAEGLDAAHVATGLTDDEGRYTLSFFGNAGVCVGSNKVTIRDEPVPDEAREMTAEGDRLRKEHKAKLLNRPIPEQYLNLGLTPLYFEVTSDKTEYNIEIKR